MFAKDAVCTLLDQLGVSTESMRDSIVVIDSSSVPLKETMVGAATHAALSPSRPLFSVGSSSSRGDDSATSDRNARYSRVTVFGLGSRIRSSASSCDGSVGGSDT